MYGMSSAMYGKTSAKNGFGHGSAHQNPRGWAAVLSSAMYGNSAQILSSVMYGGARQKPAEIGALGSCVVLERITLAFTAL